LDKYKHRPPGKIYRHYDCILFWTYSSPKLLFELETNNSIDLNSRDGTYGRSALSWAAGNGFDIAVNLLIEGFSSRLKTVKLPVRKRAKVDSADRYGRTPLVYAVWNRHVAVVKLLLKAGARVGLRDEIGGTPLSYAVCNGHEDVLQILIKKGSKVDSEDSLSAALLISAAEMGHEAVVKLLLETGKVNPELKDKNGRTPLSGAAEMGHEAIVKLLLETGKVDPDVKDKNGWTPLSHAIEGESVAVVQHLLAWGVKIDYKYYVVSECNNIRISLS
jgi:ankyrin repeat domain-containing protein 50